MFNKVDINNWDRSDEFRLYTEVWPSCLYTVTKKIDVTKFLHSLKEKKIKFTPALFYVVTKALNSIINFRYSYVDGEFGYFDEISPLYTTINVQGNLSFHYVNYDKNFEVFYNRYLKEQELNKDQIKALPENLPNDYFSFSNIPFIEVDAFSFNLRNPKYYLLPMVESFKIIEKDGKSFLPLSITVNHATVDLLHVNNLVEKILENINEFLV